MNPLLCIAPDGTVIHSRSARRLLRLVERDVERRPESELRRLLVADAVASKATDLRWAIPAYERIGKLSKRGAEEAYLDVLTEVEALTGLRLMPMA